MKGAKLARDWLVLGAESQLAASKDELIDVHTGFTTNSERWSALTEKLRSHTVLTRDDDPICQRLHHTHGLSSPDYWLLMMSAATELYPEAAAAASVLAEDERIQLITPVVSARLLRAGLELEFEEALRGSLPNGPLRRLGLLEAMDVIPGRPTTHQGLRLRAHELSALLSGGHEFGAPRALDVTHVTATDEPAYSTRSIVGAWELLDVRGLLGLRCTSTRAGRQFALDVASRGRQDALFVAIDDTLPELAELGRLHGGVVVLDFSAWPNEKPFPRGFVERAAQPLQRCIAIVPHQASTGELATLPVPAIGLEESHRIWTQFVPDAADANWLSERFRLGVEEVRLAIAEAQLRAMVEDNASLASRDQISCAVLSQGSRRMARSVTHLHSDVTVADLMVPRSVERKIHDIIGWYSTSARVNREYGLRNSASRDMGLACLFTGQAGTGKTFAAQCIANELGLNLYRVDLSQVVSKYIGETEKALAQVFEEAEAGHGVLLFDEADALFGKRTDVKDAHDRYANVEVGYLLQRMESFSGVAILTTNFRNNIDNAFARRLRFVVEFPVPDIEQRRRLWERALPSPSLCRKDLDPRIFIERFRLSGGHIQNIGLAAAHLAAATPDGLLGPEQLVIATYHELEKAGHTRSAAEFGPLACFLQTKDES